MAETTRNWSGLEDLRPDLATYLARRCRDQSEVDDIVQETLLRAARYRPSLTDPACLRAWVLRIAGNVFRDHVRRECRLPRLDASDELLLSVEGREIPPGDVRDDMKLEVDGVVLEKHVAVEHLDGALRCLRQEDQDVLGSYYAGDGGCGVTARECDIAPRLVKVRLFRARRRLLRAMRGVLVREGYLDPAPEELESQGVRRERPKAAAVLAAWILVSVPALASRALPRAGAAAAVRHAASVGRAQGPAPASVSAFDTPAFDTPAVAAFDTPAVAAFDTVEEQLAHARAQKLAMRGTVGDARIHARSAAIAAYRQVRERFPDRAAEVAEASFRAGELLRAAGDADGARAEFAIARERGEKTPFRARSAIEIGHIERRGGRSQPALAAYESVVADGDADPEQRDTASLWAGRVYQDLERTADAERVWKRVADGGVDPLDRVRAYDYLALAAIRRGDLEGAAGVLETCRRALEEVTLEETRLGEQVRNAVLSMRGVEELKRIVAEREVAARAPTPSPED